ncbi:molecular chaperone GrpE [Mastigocoleus testarum BC008]|uniref:Protein GrpE n=2 Tax=Mastigocoleus TaxID=996924 RepID=A0A0V7ZDY8_9CYAN|nr:nucleotide exchange factor GrpE [Mastigocoleus testarum]KST62768.1 molecular chaperone GrpE [Mastigocoleus testarum BC008]
MTDEENKQNDTIEKSDEPKEENQEMIDDSAVQANADANEPADEVTEEATKSDSPTVDENVSPNPEPQTVANETVTNTVDSAQLVQMTQQIESLKAQLEERTIQYARLGADFDNYRKRMLKEKEELDLQVKQRAITELLPVVDNFERARAQIKPQNDGEMGIHKSYQGVYKLLVDCLKRLGVAPMRPEGKEFDPNLHEAVMREPTDEHPEGTVLEELVRGYYLGERVLRHAMVKVAAPKEDTSVSEEDTSSSASS